MIDIYLPKNENFDNNGDMVIEPTLCTLDQSMSDNVWSVEIEHPIDSFGRWRYIVENAVIKANGPKGKQLYRINKIRVSDSGVYATAKPIFLDAKNDCFIVDIRPTNKNGEAALKDILSPNRKYTGESNIMKRNTAYYVLKNAIEAIDGSENSFLTRWGGEVEYDNYKIIINERIGADNGVELLYGKNILEDGLKETINIENVVTRIVPKSYNGYTLGGSAPWIDSPIATYYPIIRTKVIEYPHIRLRADVQSTDDDEDLIVCDTIAQVRTKLREAVNAEFAKEDVDRPEVSIDVNLAAIQNTEEYRNYKALETVNLGDTVHCRHSKLGITTTARVTQMTWDLIRGIPTKVTVGQNKRAFIKRVTGSVASTERALTKDGEVIAKQIAGVIDMSRTQLIYQKHKVTV